jgi:hypothetical protein
MLLVVVAAGAFVAASVAAAIPGQLEDATYYVAAMCVALTSGALLLVVLVRLVGSRGFGRA